MTDDRTLTGGLRLDDISIRFGDVTAVRAASLAIAEGEFFTLLGPSGCGKTTLLRAIAGFWRQSAGTIRLGETVLDDVPPWKRDVGMVFQNYAVFPHLNVRDNVAYGLKTRGIRGAELEARIRDSLAMVDLTGFETRMPRQLSGGQQQRVVIARAVAIRPGILLMDEPLANLDAKLRVRLRNDLKALQRRLGITTVYVTHDQQEALNLSDRIAVMSAGRVLQAGTPRQIYDTPASLKVAQFIGEGTFLRARASAEGAASLVTLPGGQVLRATGHGAGLSGEVWLGLRPQDLTLTPGEGGEGLPGRVLGSSFSGSWVDFTLDCGLPRPVLAQVHARTPAAALQPGEAARVQVDPAAALLFAGADEDSEL